MTREEAILILQEEAEFLYGDFLPGNAPYNKTAFDMAIEALKAETEWVPCDTSGMPPEGEEVLVSNGRHIWIDESVAGDITEEGCMMWWGDGSDWIDTAWMPLPKPYKGGDTE